ncbi:MAG: PSD1 and planctomycete cytochrome C domain-containing protein [Planctomyces sp.]
MLVSNRIICSLWKYGPAILSVVLIVAVGQTAFCEDSIPAGASGSANSSSEQQSSVSKGGRTSLNPSTEKELVRILSDRCLSCHGDDPKGGLKLNSAKSMLHGGDSGAAVVPGHPEQSLLITRIRASESDETRMPPEGSRLSAAQITTLEDWIRSGAPWPQQLVLKSPREAAQEHWAFRPVVRPELPSPHDASANPQSPGQLETNPIDALIRSRLKQQKIEPSPEADRRTLLRRASLDLTGLLPTAESVELFLADNQPGAWERAVDRLLMSPHYGERWARPWLDLCHFADTDGYLTDQRRPVAWRYRDWLIRAINQDLPFDQFTIEQLAGDLLPNPTLDQLLATGFLRNTLSNREGGADLEEFRVEQVVDRTTLVGIGWMGLTVGCARCHDHKYDPMTQSDFYRLYAILDQADEVNIDAPLEGEAEAFQSTYAEYRRKRDELTAPIRDELEALQARWEARMLQAVARPSEDPLWDRQWEVLGLVWGGQLGEGQLEGCEIVRTPRAQRTPDEQDRLQDYFLASGSLIDGKKFSELKLSELTSKINELKKEVRWPTRAPTMRQARHHRPVHIHVRGDFRVVADPVEPGVPKWLEGKAQKFAVSNEGFGRESRNRSLLTTARRAEPGQSSSETASTANSDDSTQQINRLDLAKWLVRRDHPLTARVVVNRMWQEFFGRGLVDPPDDFGLRGPAPAYPELLDWLAAEFMESGWRVKSMHRLIVTSKTYRQSSIHRSDLASMDPGNQFLARQVPMRLSADQVRDTALQVSGLLNIRIGGPSVFPPQPESVSREGYSNEWKTSEGQDRYRRGLYTWLQRLSPYSHNVTFDAPPPNSVCTRRDRSNSPLQALALLNDPVFFEASRSMAENLLKGPLKDDSPRIESLMQTAFSRSATDQERDILMNYLMQQRASADEITAWTNLCTVILNQHELITRD